MRIACSFTVLMSLFSRLFRIEAGALSLSVLSDMVVEVDEKELKGLQLCANHVKQTTSSVWINGLPCKVALMHPLMLTLWIFLLCCFLCPCSWNALPALKTSVIIAALVSINDHALHTDASQQNLLAPSKNEMPTTQEMQKHEGWMKI